MQDHPVPQNVTSYQFRLVGNMTLKQFLELGAGLFLAYIVYLTNLYFFIKWPLILLSILLGIGLAWFPVEERPLDQWIISFLKAIYQPTRYTWKKSTSKPTFFDYKPKPKESAKKSPIIKKSASNALLTFGDDEGDTEIDLEVKAKATEIDRLLSLLPSPSGNNTSVAIPAKPTIKVRSLSSPNRVSGNVIFQSQKPILPTTSATITTQPEAKVIFDQDPAARTEVNENSNNQNILLRNQPQSSKSIPIPESKPQSVTSSDAKEEPISEAFTEPAHEPVVVDKPTATKRDIGTNLVKAQTITQYMPITPKSPNIVVGVVADPQGGIVENAIVQISDRDGIPQRAVKTNELGQFAISTPLSKGDYIIEVEGEQLNFPPQELKVENKIINPLLIQAS